MEFIWNHLVLVGVLNALLAILVAVACWRYRGIPAARPLIGMMISVGLWALFGSLEMASVGVRAKVFWNTLLYIPLLMAPTFYLIFALSYTGKVRLLVPWVQRTMALVPLLMFLMTTTNSRHHLVWTSFTPGPDNILHYGHGPIFWLGLVGYTYVLFFLASGLLLRAVALFPRGYRLQAVLVAASSLIPFLGSFLYLTGLSPIPGLDLTPLCLAWSGALMGLGVLRLNLLELIPVARATLVENMPDGLVVFDNRQRILDFNAVASQFFGKALSMGGHMRDLPPAWSDLVELLKSPHQGSMEIFVSSKLVLEARITPLPVPGHSNQAHVVMLRDITRLKQAENALREANERLRDLAVRDELTGLYNRRFLMDALPRELARARREKVSLAIAIMDIDHFKQFNDQHGHQAGDAMLKALGMFLRARIRKEDLACRYGGEEFVLILTGADENNAMMRAEALRREFAEFGVGWKKHTLRATLSIGVACYPDHGGDETRVLHCADQALYAAKAAGRNCSLGASSVALPATGMVEIYTP
jgi:diguanylate cyclase (GGDEF)-like protein